MSTPTDPVELSAEEAAVLHNFENGVRAWAARQAKDNNVADALNVTYNAQILGILAKFNTNVLIPNTCGLAGSQALNVGAETVTIVSHIQNILANFNDAGHRQLWAKAAGGLNLVG